MILENFTMYLLMCSQHDIFSVNPFVQRKKGDREFVSINFINSLWQFIKMKRTFGESKNIKATY